MNSSVCVCVFVSLTLLHAAVVRRLGPARRGRRAPPGLAERVAPVDALPGAEAHASAGAGADVGRRVGQPGEVLRLGGRHREAHRGHGRVTLQGGGEKEKTGRGGAGDGVTE